MFAKAGTMPSYYILYFQKAAGLGVEVVFVSSDQSEEAMLDYMKESHGDWLAVQFGDKTAEELSKKYGQQKKHQLDLSLAFFTDISGIPSLVVVKKDGTVVTHEGEEDVDNKTPEQAVKDWKA